jgi:prepilin-type N-terminal cleavage/methylation domain-containing protein/prepilin-type processing-associated H-X9-DG protein
VALKVHPVGGQVAGGGRVRGGFTLIELLVVVAILVLLLSILLPGLGRARDQARGAVCGSNVRQLVLANITYAGENGGRYCPGAAGLSTLNENLRRWHGSRAAVDEPFDPQRGPLAAYLGTDGGVRACPARPAFVSGPAAFEAGCGGYGYNQSFLGQVLRRKPTGCYAIVTDLFGASAETVRRPAETVMFTDAAFAAVAGGVIEYSFCEPRFHVAYCWARMDPSIHFRHCGRASVAWCDGHVSAERRTATHRSGLYPGDPAEVDIGWFGGADDNGPFDLD